MQRHWFVQGQNEQKEKENILLIKELEQIKEQNGNLESRLQLQQKDTEYLKVCFQTVCKIQIQHIIQYIYLET